jgi:hypothetical protein
MGQMTRTMIKAATRGTVILLAAAAFAAGCTAAPQRKAAPPPGAAGARPALTLGEQRVDCSTPWRQASRPLPVWFVADGAVLCALTTKPAHGGDRVVFVKQVADHGLAPLVAALRRPSARPSPGMICPTQLVVVAPFFLIDADGLVIRPVIPTDACGQPEPQVQDALQHVPWVTVHARGAKRVA